MLNLGTALPAATVTPSLSRPAKASERTREGTLYRLRGVTPTEDGMFDALTESSKALYVFTHGTRLERTVIAGAPAVVLATQVSAAEAEWCRDMSATTGLDITYETQRSSGLILIAVDGVVYAFGYGASGHHLIPEELKDHRFGVQYTIRTIDPAEIQDLDRIRPGAGGRTDTTTIPGGSPIRMIGMAEHAETVRQIGGKIAGSGLAFTARNGRPVMVRGGAGVRTRFPVPGDDSVAAIREIARV